MQQHDKSYVCLVHEGVISAQACRCHTLSLASAAENVYLYPLYHVFKSCLLAHSYRVLQVKASRLTQRHKARLILSYSFTCVLQSNEDIGLPVWLLSYYKTEVVSCHLCMIADSLSQVKCVSFTQTSSYSCCHSLRLHLYIPRLEFHSERLQNTKSIPSTD